MSMTAFFLDLAVDFKQEKDLCNFWMIFDDIDRVMMSVHAQQHIRDPISSPGVVLHYA